MSGTRNRFHECSFPVVIFTPKMEEPVAKQKILVGIVMIVALLALQTGAAFAAPAAQATSITGVVQSVTQSTDSSGKPIFVVTVLETGGTTQTVQVSPQTAIDLGLVTDNGDGTYTIVSPLPTDVKTIDSSMIFSDPCVLPTDANQPVGAALTSFFCKNLGVDYTTLQDLHTEGFGYGEIAQACFMAEALGGDATMCSDILMAKQNNDIASLVDKLGLQPPEGTKITNWGLLKKYVLSAYAKNTVNLGGIMSGRTDPGALVPGEPMVKMHGNGNANGHDKGNTNGHGNGHNKP